VAISQLEAGIDVDVVFSDIVMAGGTSGYDVARWVRTHRPGLGLLLTTGFADEAVRDSTADLGDIPILAKPYARAQLAEAIQRCLEM
jgi:DNA-binding LytR/AlgR family response regulator